MKKLWLSICISLLLLGKISKADSYGFGIGVNVNNYSTNPDALPSSGAGLILGIYGEKEMSRLTSIEYGLRYNQKKVNLSSPDLQLTGIASYLESFLLLKLKSSASPSRFYGLFGLGSGFKIAESFSSGGVSVSTNLARSTDIDLQLGVGFEGVVDQGKSIFLNLVYSLGLANVANTSTDDWKSRGFQAVTGMKFTVGD